MQHADRRTPVSASPPRSLGHSPTAVIAYNDVLAIGVIKGLRRARVRVPEDVSVIGFDNVLLAEIVDPELTTVAAPLRAMGVTGATNLVAVIGGARASREPIVMPVTLVVRGSTGKRRRTRIKGHDTAAKALR